MALQARVRGPDELCSPPPVVPGLPSSFYVFPTPLFSSAPRDNKIQNVCQVSAQVRPESQNEDGSEKESRETIYDRQQPQRHNRTSAACTVSFCVEHSFSLGTSHQAHTRGFEQNDQPTASEETTLRPRVGLTGRDFGIPQYSQPRRHFPGSSTEVDCAL
ncbi:hypothetical protein BDW02DRAFT_175860 [Decorospora gaudefroyi]|uniref:Uncharacterized protein n=1 Tax=Decorospora gaudefroyi TaxID=184978 RepID=A0A6A5K7H5_9PLEO|nr:hypothetical protein BDW02DRAFT_175860 [Decorospora gaudefroyi]